MNNLLTGLITSGDAASLGIVMMIIFVMIFAIIGIYIYTSFALMAIAKKTKTEPAWLAWIPIANLALIAKIAKMKWWPILLTIPAFVCCIAGFIFLALKQNLIGVILLILYGIILIPFIVYSTIWYWKMFKAVNRPGWWSLVPIVPSIIYLILSFPKSVLLNILGSLFSLGGSVAFLVLIGISAWSDVPKQITKNKKR